MRDERNMRASNEEEKEEEEEEEGGGGVRSKIRGYVGLNEMRISVVSFFLSFSLSLSLSKVAYGTNL